MSKSGIKNTISSTEQGYTEKDVNNFKPLMHFPQSVNHPQGKAKSKDTAKTPGNSCDFTEFDNKQFNNLSAELSRFRKTGGANMRLAQKPTGSDGYTDSDNQLFETLSPEPSATATLTRLL